MGDAGNCHYVAGYCQAVAVVYAGRCGTVNTRADRWYSRRFLKC